MIAMVAGSEDTREGPIPIALAHAGFEVRKTSTTDEADGTVEAYGAKSCVVVVDAGSLGRRAGSTTWSGFLKGHRAVPAVVVTRGGAYPELEAAVDGRHRIRLDDPFDAAAVVAAARQASSCRRPPVQRAPQPLQQAG